MKAEICGRRPMMPCPKCGAATKSHQWQGHRDRECTACSWHGTYPPRQLNVRHLERHATKAITRRLRYSAPQALRAVERDGDAVVIRVNSGGNELAVEQWLNLRGYRAEYAGGNPDGYGCAVRVTLRRGVSRAGQAGENSSEEGRDEG
jgi:hypothetical protein